LKAVVLNHKEKLSTARKKVYFYITIQEGIQYLLGDVQFHGNIQFDDSDLKKALNLSFKTILRQNDLDDGIKKMKTLYADKGYIYAGLVPKIDYDDDLKKADITFNITEGQVAYVQDIKIVGNYKTQDYVIRRELLIKAGDKFEADRIKASAGNLYNLGFFDEVNPEVEPGDSPGKEILVFRVKERKTGTISLGGGYSSVDGFIGNLKLEEANLFGKGQKVNLDLQFGASQTSVAIGFTEPWLFNTPTSLGVNLFDTTRIYTTAVPDPIYGSTQFYTEISVGGSISLGRRLSRFWTVNGTYLLENVQIENVGQYYSTPGTSQYIQASNSTTSSFTPRITYDNRDNYFDPHTGWKHQLSFEIAGGPLGFDNNFLKLIEDSSHFIPLPLDFVLGEHVRLGAAQGYWFSGRGYSDVPIYEKFYAGGTDTVRGYNERTIGPIQGGNALFVWNNELKHPIAGPLRGVVFFDTGDAWSTPYNVFGGENQVQFGAGIGLRLTIPGTIMDIRLDYGWPIDSSLPTTAAPPGGVLHFNLGNLF
jgi:outer membrane protein insertion porin family